MRTAYHCTSQFSAFTSRRNVRFPTHNRTEFISVPVLHASFGVVYQVHDHRRLTSSSMLSVKVSGVYLFRTSINQYLWVTPDVTHVTGFIDMRETETQDLCTVVIFMSFPTGNRKATHTVTSHWYRSSRACGVGSGEWVHGTHPVRWFSDSESVGSHQMWVSVCASMLSVQSVRYSQGVPSHTQGERDGRPPPHGLSIRSRSGLAGCGGGTAVARMPQVTT